MNIKTIKTTGLSLFLATAFLFAAGAAGNSTAFAQGLLLRDRDHDGGTDTRRERFEERWGFNDGLIKGRADALAYRRFNPFPYRRFVSDAYRQGFHKGYAQAYRQFANSRGRRYGYRY